jgi:hypothetical protein
VQGLLLHESTTWSILTEMENDTPTGSKAKAKDPWEFEIVFLRLP